MQSTRLRQHQLLSTRATKHFSKPCPQKHLLYFIPRTRDRGFRFLRHLIKSETIITTPPPTVRFKHKASFKFYLESYFFKYRKLHKCFYLYPLELSTQCRIFKTLPSGDLTVIWAVGYAALSHTVGSTTSSQELARADFHHQLRTVLFTYMNQGVLGTSAE